MNGLLNLDPLSRQGLLASLLKGESVAPVTANRNMLAQALKARTKPEFQMKEPTLQGILDNAALATSPVPILGDVVGLGADANRFITDPSSRTPANFGLAALGLIPFLPSIGAAAGLFKGSAGPSMGGNQLGILNKSDLSIGGAEFGNWKLNRVERRTRPEEYIDSTGQERVKYVADMENAEKSHGSGQPVANIYWMENKKTGEIKPFGDDTAHYAMGKESSSYAKKKFREQLSNQRNDWFKSQSESLGFKWNNEPYEFQRIREMLLFDKINEGRAAELMKSAAEKMKK